MVIIRAPCASGTGSLLPHSQVTSWLTTTSFSGNVNTNGTH